MLEHPAVFVCQNPGKNANLFHFYLILFFKQIWKKEKKHEIWSCSDCRYAINTVLVCVCVGGCLKDLFEVAVCWRAKEEREKQVLVKTHSPYISWTVQTAKQIKDKVLFSPFSFSFFLSWKDHLDRRDMTRRMVYTLDFPFCRDMEERGDVYSRIEPDTKPQQIPASGCCVTHSRSP
jgi:hypothetical protein